MVSAPSIIRTHIKGVVHQKLVSEHYQQYKDPETILKEESIKKPCIKFAKGECQFGGICRYSHYTAQELHELRLQVAANKRTESEDSNANYEEYNTEFPDNKSRNCNEKNTMIYDENGVTHIFPWAYNSMFDNYEVLFSIEVTSHPSFNFLRLRDQLKDLAIADAKYQNTIHKYDSIKTQNELDEGNAIIFVPIRNHGNNYGKQIARMKKQNELKAEQMQAEHEARMKEVIYFMKDHMMTTKYLYDEVQRIKRTRRVKGNLRKMVEYLEKPERYKMKKLMLRFFKVLVKRFAKKSSVWDQEMHDTAINIIKDPFNDGVIN
ncbi:unnamed protein product, partial [Brenthis ino]